MEKLLLKVQIDKFYSLTKMEDFENILEFLKQQEILCKQEMEKFQKQRQENLKRHWKELEIEERFSK